MAAILEWLVVGVIGAAVGAVELISRYKDEPDNALSSWPAVYYLLINALASVGALGLIRVFKWDFGVTDPAAAGWTQVIVAGFGAMAILRASVFTVKVGAESVPIGPSRFLEALLIAVDQGVDRKRAQGRSAVVSKVMKDISFDKAYMALPTYCLALMQNLPQPEQEQFARKINLIRSADMSPHIKSLLLGLALMNVVGEGVLKAAVEHLGGDLKPDPAPPRPETQ
ncbi:MAG: hypothetical protein C0393_07540 [Anaerolinea sp.]|nr:hypothetical protein [Anaerolinea sp.]